jgi:hypothetical protein
MTAAKSREVKTERSKSRQVWQNLLRKAMAKKVMIMIICTADLAAETNL